MDAANGRADVTSPADARGATIGSDPGSEGLEHEVARLLTENARLGAVARRSVGVLESLSQLGEAVSRAATLDALLPAVAARTVGLLDAGACQIYLFETVEGRLRLHASAPALTASPALVSLHHDGRRELPLEPARMLAMALWGGMPARSALLVPLLVAGEPLGFLAARTRDGRPFSDEDRDLAGSVASQTAVAVKKIQLIDRLTERNLMGDFFDDLSRGVDLPLLAERGRRLGLDLERPHVVFCAEGFRNELRDVADELERLERELARSLPGAVADRRDDGLRGLIPLAATTREAERDVAAVLRGMHGAVAPGLVVGLSSACNGAVALAIGFDEARQAARAAPVVHEGADVVPFDDLGAYKYLFGVSQGERVRDRHAAALRQLVEYDRTRHAQLVRTLEEYLRRRGNVSATAQALYLHPNTLRQRLHRIAQLTQLDVRTDDWLMIEIALKLHRLETALAPG